MRIKINAMAIPIFILLFSIFTFSYDVNFDYDGAVLTGSDALKEEYKKPDGTMITKYKDREEAVFKDTTRVVRFGDGRKEIYNPDGSEIHMQSDGSVKYINPDRSERIISMDGKTPYGMEIKEDRRLLQRKDFVVELVYSAALSDDNMDDYFIAFFNELASQIEIWMDKHNLTRETVRIAVSNCRFCKTGFCKRKNVKEIAVIRFKGNKEDKKISFRHEQVVDTKKHAALTLQAVEALFGK